MKAAELKTILKPLIKECIKEVIFEDGVLSGIISEVAQGLSTGVPLVEQRKPQTKAPKKAAAAHQQKKQHERKQLLDSINKDAYNGVNIFEGTEPMSTGGTSSNTPQPAGVFSDTAPSDPGVNIDGILNIAGTRWGKFI